MWSSRTADGFHADPSAIAVRDADLVRSCDVFVLLLGWQYGARPAGSPFSYTHLEHRDAVESDRERLVFLGEDTPLARPSTRRGCTHHLRFRSVITNR